MSQLNTREGKKSDCSSLYELVKEAAQTNKIPVDPNLTPEGLEEIGFGPSPGFYSIVAEKDHSLVGYALYYYTYSTWEGRSVCMEDLFVTGTENHNDVATAMWKKLVEVALAADCGRCNITALQDKKEMLNFYECHKAINLTKSEAWHFFRMNQDSMAEFVKGSKVPEGITIREATPSDCIGIRKQIQDLADYEKMPEGPQIDAEVLKTDGFGKQVFYKACVAEEEGEMVGYTLYFFTFNWEGRGVYMEDLYVSPSHRSRGIGMALWRKVIRDGMALQGIRCDFAVLDWNLPSIEFYKSKGAADMTELRGFLFYRMRKEEMEEFVKK
ncbi:putative spermidine/spermine N(1)-acetyltransferase-like protein 1 [Penaeus vannamei]|uniref:Putative spermidine/spermine N(1)-acetyltransferase-like protein 1 n=1 Tax=Penaeus vannamei TaxID=6689 RepID=A0A423TVR2_PENVA|nr:spermidine/spermine N(1)-acetyltransferase-like protein 1 [Penaeus vannamei]XP_027215054.1 spermidine/spermine N(1)-acetyltransferase-like protein 1 [Penaeus vannamei]ROT80544.1 putative spermidine/spermine N(1)-acetyltransferase-like protein 1 [Penaeus vannamei]